jgi:hypothetical protein
VILAPCDDFTASKENISSFGIGEPAMSKMIKITCFNCYEEHFYSECDAGKRVPCLLRPKEYSFILRGSDRVFGPPIPVAGPDDTVANVADPETTNLGSDGNTSVQANGSTRTQDLDSVDSDRNPAVVDGSLQSIGPSLDLDRIREEMEQLAYLHKWEMDMAVECVLFCMPVAMRIGEEKIRQILDGLNVKTSNLSSVLKRLVRGGTISDDDSDDEKRYFLQRYRHAQLEAALSDDNPTPVSRPEYTAPARSVSKWRMRLLKWGLSTLGVAVSAGIGHQLEGWVGAVITGGFSLFATFFIGDFAASGSEGRTQA